MNLKIYQKGVEFDFQCICTHTLNGKEKAGFLLFWRTFFYTFKTKPKIINLVIMAHCWRGGGTSLYIFYQGPGMFVYSQVMHPAQLKDRIGLGADVVNFFHCCNFFWLALKRSLVRRKKFCC